MSKPTTQPPPRAGALSRCAVCGAEVQFNGWFWQHTDGSGKHLADPPPAPSPSVT